MARSFKDLIEFLLAEISLCGEQGASTSDITKFIDDFYSVPDQASTSFGGTGSAGRRQLNADCKFKQKVWSWLTRHPEVSVGAQREGNDLTLDEVEARSASQQLSQNDADIQISHHFSDNSVSGEQPPSTELAEAPIERSQAQSVPPKNLRVYVSELRMWLAITGHEPDTSKVLPLEFALLSIIASRKEKGILQADLVRLSGQDKRSVPKRTDGLSQKGYIEKRAIQFNSSRTSLCTLRKFVSASAASAEREVFVPLESSGDNQNKSMVDFDALLGKVFGCLKEYQIITLDDLKWRLQMQDRWRATILRKAIQRLEVIGCLRRVKAASEYSTKRKATHLSVMLIRKPTENDRKLFHELSRNLVAIQDQGEDENAEAEDDEDIEEADGGPSISIEDTDKIVANLDGFDQSAQRLPQWTPDRNMANLIFDLVDRSGLDGMTNLDIMASCMGAFYKRPLEMFLSRMVDSWQFFQPPHLRHLSIVRDSALRGTNFHYIHYSFLNFAALVESGEASWEAVERPPPSKGAARALKEIGSKAELDKYGFPLNSLPKNLVKGGNATLAQCLRIAQPPNYRLNYSDPRLVEYDDGTYEMQFHEKWNELDRDFANGESYFHPQGGIKKRKHKSVEQGSAEPHAETPARKRKKLMKTKSNPFEGMSEKEMLEAQGFDETWTEYSILTLERPHTGIFITPLGRRRPEGKARGRPPKSRIAVIKTPKLAEFTWFRSDGIHNEQAVSAEGDTQSMAVNDTAKRSDEILPVADQQPVDRFENRQIDQTHDELPSEPAKLPATQAETTVMDVSGQPQGMDERNVSKKRKRPDFEDAADAGDHPKTPQQRPPRRRGRPPKVPRVAPTAVDVDSSIPEQGPPADQQVANADVITNTESVASVTPKRRGRPPKKNTRKGRRVVSVETEDTQHSVTSDVVNQEAVGPLETHKSVGKRGNKGLKSTKAEPGWSVQSALGQVGSRKVNIEEEQGMAAPHVEGHTARGVELPQGDQMGSGEEGQPTFPIEVDKIIPTEQTSTEQVSKSDVLEFVDERVQDDDIAEALPDAETQELARTSEGVVADSQLALSDLDRVQTDFGPVENQDLRSSAGVSTVNGAGHVSAEPEQGKRQASEVVSESRKSDFDTQSMASINGRVKFKKPSVRTGSVSVLRQKIVMDIVGGAGGVFPLGTELWYPFTTAWSKAKRSGKPDSRTVRATARSLLESGKLKQVTFSGKNSKGLVITKSLIMKPDISSTDPRVAEMQRLMIKADPHLYIPPSAEVDPVLSKKKSYTSMPSSLRIVPEVRPDIMVKLQQKPALPPRPTVRRRKRSFVFENQDETAVGQPKVQRLKSTMRRAPAPSPLNSLSFLSFRVDEGRLELPRYVRGKQKIPSFLRRYPVIAKGHLSRLIMAPSVALHSPSGTFGTGVREIGRPGRKPKPTEPPELVSELPDTLDDILSSSARRRNDAGKFADPVSSQFFSEVDAVRLWEKDNPEIFDIESEEWKYVNHVAQGWFESAPIEGQIRFEGDDLFKTKESEARAVHRAFMPPPIQRVFRAQPAPSQVPTKRRLTQLQEPGKTPNKAASDRSAPFKRLRAMRSLPEDMIQRLIATIVVGRTLAGGLEGRMMDWPLFAPLFPDQDMNSLVRRGRNIMARHRLQLAKMQSDFQEKFAEAYEKGEVPPIDYDNLEAYDWEWVIDWAQAQLEVPVDTDKLPDLPTTREQFDGLFEIRKEAMQNADDIYQYGANVTFLRKQALFSSTHFSVCLDQMPIISEKSMSRNERLNVAKTWVRANVITTEETYNPGEARRLLAHLGDGIIGEAIQSLITERVITMGSRGRISPGRNYDVTEYFLNSLSRKRAIESTQMKRASFFKTGVLDPQLHLEGSCDVNLDTEDGDMLALINLFSEGRITLLPRNPPKDKYGLTDGGYLTRLMDKGKLRFDVEVHAIPERYVYGNPIKERIDNTPIPRGELPSGFPTPASPGETPTLCKIPLWFDIHGQFVPLLWDLVVCSVVGVLVTRPGLTTAGISQIFHPHIMEWELVLLLQWLKDIGIIGRERDSHSGSNWEVKEWWWMVVQG